MPFSPRENAPPTEPLPSTTLTVKSVSKNADQTGRWPTNWNGSIVTYFDTNYEVDGHRDEATFLYDLVDNKDGTITVVHQ